MATPAECFYCFECLSCSFTRAEPPCLDVVEDLWEEFEASKQLAQQSDYDKTQNDAGGQIENEVNGHDSQSEDPDEGPPTRSRSDKLQPPSVSRVQGHSSSRSSSTSTPSALSVTSSRSAFTTASSTTSISPRSSSLFSQSNGYSAAAKRASLEIEYPLFVTWNTISRNGHKSLRGCIGTFEPQELADGLRSYALTSAFGDTRFSPIPSSLLPSLSCSLTLLSSFEPCADALDWVLGTHGLRISFIHRGKRLGATYLPDVAVEQGWTKEETLESLMRKAGWDGHSGSGGVARRFLRGSLNSTNTNNATRPSGKPWDEVSDFKAVRYQGLKASASYAEWQEWRKWVESSPSRRILLDPGLQ
ncbi:hypothetical protein AJ80_04412 [Polytolypa hystricis UAMH7299]|uniref:AMMECR1 domain-containing protein n=1 Tax=Polytolypa hystricis (strain UAMH7299) TaxID=1447883 RepID=A0A2B7Y3I4_POLH7|nr:hypothetical protein AJ80_04412 [Polytolypa hystricis UAMH7299]